MAKKKEFTPEEKAAYAQLQQERREDLETRVKDLVDTFKDSDSFKDYLSKMGEFSRNCSKYLHRYSPNNIVMAVMQYPQASIIGSFGAWKSMGRHVKVGEQAKMYVWAPIKGPVMRDKLDENGKPVLDENGEPVREKAKNKEGKTIYQISGGFVLKPVFDVSQTEGEPLPSLTQELVNPVENFEAFAKVLREVSPMPVYMSNDEQASGLDLGRAKGMCAYSKDMIVIREGMSEEQTLKTMIHEITHAVIHAPDVREQTAKGMERFTQEEIECQAEGTAYVVCDHLGIDTSDYSIPYLMSWSQDEGMSAFTRSLDVILDTSDKLIDQIEEKLAAELGLGNISLNETPELAEARRIMEEWTMPRDTPLLLGMPPAQMAVENPIEKQAEFVDLDVIAAMPDVAKLLASGYEMTHTQQFSLENGEPVVEQLLSFEKDCNLYALHIDASLERDAGSNHHLPNFSAATTSLFAFDKTTSKGADDPICFYTSNRGVLSEQMGELRGDEHYQNLRALDEGGFRLQSTDILMGEADYVKQDFPYEAKLTIPYLSPEYGGLHLNFSDHDLLLIVSKGAEMIGGATEVGSVREALQVFDNKKTLDQEMDKMVVSALSSNKQSNSRGSRTAVRDFAENAGAPSFDEVMKMAKENAMQKNAERVEASATTHHERQNDIQL